MTILVVGATGATGRLLVEQLLDRGHAVRVIVRSPDKLPAGLRSHANLSVRSARVLDLSDAELAEQVEGCRAVASCLGHELSLKGIFGPPYRLVTEATRRLCEAIRANAPDQPVRFLLMNSTGNRNCDLAEPISFAQHCVLALLRVVLPPHVDNEQAADFLRLEIGQGDPAIEWVAVRPDGLLDEDAVSEYAVYPSPIRSAIFDPGVTSRINVAHFMASLIDEDALWRQWQGRMPVLYNRASATSVELRAR